MICTLTVLPWYSRIFLNPFLAMRFPIWRLYRKAGTNKINRNRNISLNISTAIHKSPREVHTFAWRSMKCSRSFSMGSSLNNVKPDWWTSRQPISWFRVFRNSSIVVLPSKLTTWYVPFKKWTGIACGREWW